VIPRTVLAVIATAFAIVPGGHPEAQAGHALWAARGEHNTVYLFGSIHSLRPDDVGLPGAAMVAYDEAEQLVMEIDMDDPAVADMAEMAVEMRRAAALPEGQTLRSVLGDDYAWISGRTSALGLELATVDRLAPWFVATLVVQLEIARRGYVTEHGVEQQFVDRAVADGKPILGLETPAQQFAALGSLSLPDQKRFLVKSLEESTQDGTRLEQLVEAWRDGDTATLARVLSEEFEAFPELYGPLTEDRNRAWVEQIDDLLDDRDDYLVVVGALHLVGRNSVVELLRRRGHEVTQQ